MENKEMALELARLIIQQQKQIAVLEGVLMECRIDTPQGRREVPWREMAKTIGREESFQLVVNARLADLSQAIHDETPDSRLIPGLYGLYVGATG